MADIEGAIITLLYSAIKSNANLQALFSNHADDQEWLYYVWAQRDAPFPYLVHRLDTDVALDTQNFENSVYYIDIWDYNTTVDRLWQIRSELTKLLEGMYANIPEAGSIRIKKIRSRPLPTDATNVWREGLEFSVRYMRVAEMLEEGQA